MAARIRIVIADDHAIVRGAIRPLLEEQRGVQIVGEAEDGMTAIALTKALQPDILVLDVSLPHASGIVVMNEVQRWSPNTRVIVLTGIAKAAVLAQLAHSGAAGILLKSCSTQELVCGFRSVLSGDQYIAVEAREAMATESLLSQLTPRESQILSFALQGRTNAEIAAALHISQKTADNHRTNLMRKLNVHSITELTLLASRAGLLDY